MDTKQIREFILAGNALFTLKSNRTAKHFTYLVQRQMRWDAQLNKSVEVSPPTWNVKVLVGRDNSKDYRRIGTIRSDSDHNFIRLGGTGSSNNSNPSTSPSTKGFEWFWTKLRLRDVEKLAQVQFNHAGRCGRCGRLLTTPESVAVGIGPECQERIAFETAGGAQGLLDKLFGG